MSDLVEEKVYRGVPSRHPFHPLEPEFVGVKLTCPVHGEHMFVPGSVAIAEFRTVHEYCRVPVPAPPAPPRKSRRSAL